MKFFSDRIRFHPDQTGQNLVNKSVSFSRVNTLMPVCKAVNDSINPEMYKGVKVAIDKMLLLCTQNEI